MGALLLSQGNIEEAEQYHRDALAGFRRTRGSDHPRTLRAIANLGELLRRLGQLEEAATLCEEAAERAKRTLPAGHWQTGLFLGYYGRTLFELRRFDEAEDALLESHAILQSELGEGDRRTINIIEHLCDLYAAWDEHDSNGRHSESLVRWQAKLPSP